MPFLGRSRKRPPSSWHRGRCRYRKGRQPVRRRRISPSRRPREPHHHYARGIRRAKCNASVTPNNDRIAQNNDGIRQSNVRITQSDDGIDPNNGGIAPNNALIAQSNGGITSNNERIAQSNGGIGQSTERISRSNGGVDQNNDGITSDNDGITSNDERIAQSNGGIGRDHCAHTNLRRLQRREESCRGLSALLHLPPKGAEVHRDGGVVHTMTKKSGTGREPDATSIGTLPCGRVRVVVLGGQFLCLVCRGLAPFYFGNEALLHEFLLIGELGLTGRRVQQGVAGSR